MFENVGIPNVALHNVSKSNYKIPSRNVLGTCQDINLTGVGHPAVLGGDVDNE
jgi:hypothetical protein